MRTQKCGRTVKLNYTPTSASTYRSFPISHFLLTPCHCNLDEKNKAKKNTTIIFQLESSQPPYFFVPSDASTQLVQPFYVYARDGSPVEKSTTKKWVPAKKKIHPIFKIDSWRISEAIYGNTFSCMARLTPKIMNWPDNQLRKKKSTTKYCISNGDEVKDRVTHSFNDLDSRKLVNEYFFCCSLSLRLSLAEVPTNSFNRSSTEAGHSNVDSWTGNWIRDT